MFGETVASLNVDMRTLSSSFGAPFPGAGGLF